MPWTIRVETETGIALGTCTGVLRLDDAIQGTRAMRSAPGWAGRVAVWDFRDARFEMSSAEVTQLADFVRGSASGPAPGRVALVTAGDVEYGMARMFGAFRKDPHTDIRVFRDYDEAVRWAGELGTAMQEET